MQNLGVISELCIRCPNGTLVFFVGIQAYYYDQVGGKAHLTICKYNYVHHNMARGIM